ncbi:MAG: hypothetical protein ACTHKT_09195 [Solirubrobacterales bacterium]
MLKKLITACAAIAAFAAFVVAPVASASPVLTESGVAVPVGAEVKGSNTGTFRFEGSGGYTIECSTASLAAKVTANSGTQIKLEAGAGGFTTSGTGTGADCTANWGPTTLTWGKMCFETVKGADTVSITGCGASMTLTTNITGAAICKYTAANLTGSFITNADATINMNSLTVKLVEGGILCPAEVKFNLDFDLTTTGGTTLSIS